MSSQSSQFWALKTGSAIGQGDVLTNCLVPSHPSLSPSPTNSSQRTVVKVPKMNLIIISQDCDLQPEQDPIQWVLLCPIHSRSEFLTSNRNFETADKWESLENQKTIGLCWLPSINNSVNDNESYVVNYRNIISLEYSYLRAHAEGIGERWSLNYPYKHQLIDSVARVFSRPALPIPPSTQLRKLREAEKAKRKAEEQAAADAERRAASAARKAFYAGSQANNN